MKKTSKILAIIFVAIMLVSTVSNTAFAAAAGGLSVPSATNVDASNLNTLISKVLGVLQIVGVGVAVIWLMILGIKYMTGSTEEKAVDKKSLLPYIIGAVLVGAAPFIATAIFNMIAGATSGS